MQKDKGMKQHIYERLLWEKGPKARPFKVPEGYFDTLQGRIMDALPDGEAKVVSIHAASRQSLVRRWLAAAAVACLVIAGATAYWLQASHGEEMASMAEQNVATVSADTYIDQVADYTMMDNDDIYTYLSSNDY